MALLLMPFCCTFQVFRLIPKMFNTSSLLNVKQISFFTPSQLKKNLPVLLLSACCQLRYVLSQCASPVTRPRCPANWSAARQSTSFSWAVCHTRRARRKSGNSCKVRDVRQFVTCGPHKLLAPLCARSADDESTATSCECETFTGCLLVVEMLHVCKHTVYVTSFWCTNCD